MNNFPTDIRDYTKVYHNFFSQEFCKKTIESLKTVKWDTHAFFTAGDKYIYEGNDFLNTFDTIEEHEVIMKELWNLIYHYITVEFSKYYKQFEWFNKWRGYSIVKFHKYDENTHMKLHCDHIQDLFDGERKGVPILTIIGLLNEDFEGGDFHLWEKEKINLRTGSVLVFPSNFMYPHEVTPILKGTRYSFVSWVW